MADHSVNEFTQPCTKQEKSSDANHNTVKPIPELKGTPSNERIEWIVVLRAFACMAVIMIHIVGIYVCEIQFKDVNHYSALRRFINEILIQPLIRFAIPCFVMISGTLLLDPKRNITINKIIKYILRITVLFIVLWFAYCMTHDITLDCFRDIKVFKNWGYNSLTKFVNGLLQGNAYDYAYWLWYLPLLIGLYILTPILRKFTEHADRKTVQYLLVILFITSCFLPTLNNYYNLNIIEFTELSSVVFMYIVGHYVANTDFINSKLIYIGGVSGIIYYLFGCYFNISNQLDAFMILESMMVLKLFASRKIKIKNNPFLNCISKYSLGIYATHIFWLYVLKNLNIHITTMPVLVGEFVVFAFALTMSLLTSLILYRLPLIKKLFVK